MCSLSLGLFKMDLIIIVFFKFSDFLINELIIYLIGLCFFQGLKHFDEILQEADGVILSRGNLGVDLPPEKVNIVAYLVQLLLLT